MKFLLLSLLGLCTGCATAPRPQLVPVPSVAKVASPVQETRTALSDAGRELNHLAPHVDESGKQGLAALRDSLRTAESASLNAQQGLIVYATQVDAQTKALNAALRERDNAVAAEQKWHREAHDVARERDVILILFALFASIWIGTMLVGEVMRDLPAPWSFVAAAAIYLGIGIGAYVAGRLVLHAASRLIP